MRHGRVEEQPVRVGVELTTICVRVAVQDEGNGFEAPRRRRGDGTLDTSGWGLFLVDCLADRWGIDRHDGTSVWFEIDR